MKSMNPNYAIVYSYEEEGVGGPGGCNPTWTEWVVIPFDTLHEMEIYIATYQSIKYKDNFTYMKVM